MSHSMIVDRVAIQERHAEALDLAALAALLAENLHNRVLDREAGGDLSHVSSVADQLARRLNAHCEAIDATGAYKVPLQSTAA